MFNQHCSQGSSQEQKMKVCKWAANSAAQNAPEEHKNQQIKGTKVDLWC